MTAKERLEEIIENQLLAKKADDNGDWDAYGRYCTFQDHEWLINRVNKLTEALEEVKEKEDHILSKPSMFLTFNDGCKRAFDYCALIAKKALEEE